MIATILIMELPRRRLLQGLGLGALTLGLHFAPSAYRWFERSTGGGGTRATGSNDNWSSINPVDRSLGEAPRNIFSGDNPDRTHGILWQKDAYLSQKGGPSSSESASVVIIGGGMAGLATAYELRDLRPIVLERAERLGGNSRAESWRGIDYSIGAAYFNVPDAGSPLHQFFQDIRVNEIAIGRESELMMFGGRLEHGFWEGATDPKAKSQFTAARDLFLDHLNSRNGRGFPDMPTQDPDALQVVHQLDGQNFLSYVQQQLGDLHPHLHSLFELFAWSTHGVGARELSAAAGVCFFASEFAPIQVTPGGNAGVAERLVRRLCDEGLRDHLRTDCIVADLQVEGGGVRVLYEDAAGTLREIRASAAVMAGPKFVAGKIIPGWTEERGESLSRLRYHSYVVANALLTAPPAFQDYGGYEISNRPLHGDIASLARREGVTDFILANYAAGANHAATVLTLYRPQPYPAGRAELFNQGRWDSLQKELRDELKTVFLPALGHSIDQLKEIRLARWGHPMPVATPGLYGEGHLERLRAPFRERVFFVHQDNWALPALETSLLEAFHWAPHVRRVAAG